MAKEVIDIDGEVWTVKEMRDGLPIFVNEDDKECLYDFDIDDDYALEMEEYRRLQREMGYDTDNDYEDMNELYERLLNETENEEWMDTFEELRDKAKTERKLKAWADTWYQGLDDADYSNTDEDGELPIAYFDEFQKEYMLNHKDEVQEELERKFDDHEVVDWWFEDEPTDTLFGYGGYSYDVFDLVVKFGKKLED